MSEDELPELSLEEAKKAVNRLLNEGEIEKAVKVMFYYELSKPDFAEKFMEGLLKYVEEHKKTVIVGNEQ